MLLTAIGLALLATPDDPRLLPILGLLSGSIGVRWARIGRIAARSPLTIPIVLLYASFCIAWWVAPNRDVATVRLLWATLAIALFYGLVSSRAGTRLVLGKGFAAGMAVGGVWLVGQNTWSEGARFAFIGRIGNALNQIVPPGTLQPAEWNILRNQLAAVVALAIPFAIMWLYTALRSGATIPRWRTVLSIGAATASLLLLLFDLLMTESRTPWLLLPVIGLIGVWWLVAAKFGRNRRPLLLFWLGIASFALIGIGALYVLAPIVFQLPGAETLVGRRAVYAQSLYLAQDAPFTGAGLDAFPFYYSEYVRVVPVNAVRFGDSGNNAYQITWIEQGWLGVLALIACLIVAAWGATRQLRQTPPLHPFVVAGAVSLAFVITYGVSHAVLIDTRASVMWLLPAGFALAGYPVSQPRHWVASRQVRVVAGAAATVVLTLILLLVLLQWSALRATWAANRGVLTMAQEQVVDWPRERWRDGSEVARLADAEAQFETALSHDPTNAVAHHRLGLICMLRRDYDSAVVHLEQATRQRPNHQGIRANLGYAYVWVGDYESALPLLQQTRNALQDLNTYVWWWRAQGEAVFSERAQDMAALLTEQP